MYFTGNYYMSHIRRRDTFDCVLFAWTLQTKQISLRHIS